MNKKRKFLNNSLWWLDVSILNYNNIDFFFSYENNIFFLQLNKNYYYYYSLIGKKNVNSALLYNLDGVYTYSDTFGKYILATQTIFYDFKVLIEVVADGNIPSTSQIYRGNTWIERESKEFSGIFFTNLLDNRKLLLNYNYNHDLQYNQFSNVIGDINI